MQALEIESMGIFNSKISYSDISVSHSRTARLFELELPLESEGISYIDDEQAKITTALLICAKPGQTRHTKFPFKCRYVHLAVSDAYLYKELISLPNFIEISNREMYERLFEELYKYRYSEIMKQSILLRMIYFLGEESGNKKRRDNDGRSRITDAAIEFIDNNLASDLSLEAVAKHVSISPIHFHNIFKCAVGKTLHSYIEEERIKKSVMLMQTTDMTLTEIAYRCGFSSQSYYSYVFKRKMNTTPRKYIKRLNDNYKI